MGASGSSVGTFSRAPSDAALMELVTRYRGVHHRVVMDAPHAAAVLVGITRALAQQPYRTQARAGCRAQGMQCPYTYNWGTWHHNGFF